MKKNAVKDGDFPLKRKGQPGALQVAISTRETNSHDAMMFIDDAEF